MVKKYIKKPLSILPSQVYDSRHYMVETYNKSLEDLYTNVQKRKKEEKKRKREELKAREKELGRHGKLYQACSKLWRNTIGKFGEDWIFLAFLGIMVAIISYGIDKGSAMCTAAQKMLFTELADNYFSKWVAWVSLPVILILWDVAIIQLISPNSIGSGLPQIKTCLRGAFMKEFLTWKVLIAKWLGITATLGSGMPLGKEGSLIHMSCIIVTKMAKAMSSFHSDYLNESKKIELLGAAWAVGVACTFNSPIGGVLFSIEISTTYFAVRNYWRGFYAAVWGATVYRLLYVWIDGLDTIRVVFTTNFITDFPYDPFELISFAILGAICGFGGCFYLWCKGHYTNWVNGHKTMVSIKKLNRFIYPGFIVLFISTITWPPGIGQFMASSISPKEQVENLFSNFTWTAANHTIAQKAVLNNWTTPYSGIYTNLVVYFWYQFITSILAASLPIPHGSFIPNFRAGAALGRIAGELMATWFPLGVRYKGKITHIMPGAYATVGATAFGGAVTHTLSASIILFEMTSQISHVIPVLISNLIANGIARIFSSSIYDMAIKSGKMPYLPDLLPSSSAVYNVCVENFMIRDVKFIYLGMTYEELKAILIENKDIKILPLVDNHHNMILLGSISRRELIKLIEKQIGYQRRREILPNAIIDREEDEGTSSETLDKDEKFSDAIVSQEREKLRERIFKKYDLRWIKRAKSVEKLEKSTSTDPDRPPAIRICDLPMRDQIEWEMQQMAQLVDFTLCLVDPAPLQLVERTSLLKVHSLFSLMGIRTAYVTSIGKLIGVVGLRDLRQAIEDANSGKLPRENYLKEDVEQPLLPK